MIHNPSKKLRLERISHFFVNSFFFENAVSLPLGLKSKIGRQQIVAKILKFRHSKYQNDPLTQLREITRTDSHVKRYPEELP